VDNQHCKALLGELSDYVDGELAANLCAELERHLETCPDCRIVVDTLRKTISLYHQANETTPLPDDVKQRLYRSLHLEDFVA
jgi:anti-sigma factor RsiW